MAKYAAMRTLNFAGATHLTICYGSSEHGGSAPNGTYLRVLAGHLLLRVGLLKIVVFVRMASSYERKRRFTRTDFSFVPVLAALPRANRALIRINPIRIKARFLNKADSLSWISELT